jgi:hypothetical protein
MRVAHKHQVYNELKTAFNQNLTHFSKDLHEFVGFTSDVLYTYCADTITGVAYKIKNWDGWIGLGGYIKLYK